MPTLDAGGEMDALIAEKVMGWKRVGAEWHTRPGHRKSLDHPGQTLSDYSEKGPHDYLIPPVEQWHDKRVAYCGCESTVEIPPYSTSIAAAWLVVEKLRADRWQFACTLYNDKMPYASFCRGVSNAHNAEAETMPLAICLASLKAMEVP